MYKRYIKRKEKVIISAIDILDEGGILGFTTKVLSKREGITEPALYRQFKSKQDIVFAVIEKFAEFDSLITNTIIEQKMNPKDGILFFTESYASYYQSYPQITTVLFSMDIFKYEEKLNRYMLGIMDRRYDFITKLTKEAIEKKEIVTGLDAKELAEFILGIIWSTTYKWKLDGCKTGIKDLIIERVKWAVEHL